MGALSPTVSAGVIPGSLLELLQGFFMTFSRILQMFLSEFLPDVLLLDSIVFLGMPTEVSSGIS